MVNAKKKRPDRTINEGNLNRQRDCFSDDTYSVSEILDKDSAIKQ